jgi:hypothetical protein
VKEMVSYNRKAYKAKAVGNYAYAAEAFIDNYIKATQAGDEDIAKIFLEEALRCKAIHLAVTKQLSKENLPNALKRSLLRKIKNEMSAKRLEDEIPVIMNKFDDQISKLEIRSMKKEYIRRFERLEYPSNVYYISLENADEKVQLHGFNQTDASLNHKILKRKFNNFDGKFPFEVVIRKTTFMIDSDGSFEAIASKEKLQSLKEDAYRLAKILEESMTP